MTVKSVPRRDGTPVVFFNVRNLDAKGQSAKSFMKLLLRVSDLVSSNSAPC